MSKHSVIARLTRFARRDEGSMSMEAMILIPILFWAFAGVFTFFDAFRQSAVNLKSAYTISDLISRETEAINDEYIDSMVSLFELMTRTGSDTKLRISVVRWDADDDRHYVDWSAIRGYSEKLTDANISAFETRLPDVPDSERIILVETSNRYQPPFWVGLDVTDMENFVFTRPRFTDQVASDFNT